MTSMVNPLLSLYRNKQQVPENLKNISTYKDTQQQEQQKMLANQAAGRGYASMSPQGMQQQSPYMQQQSPYMQQQSPYMQQQSPYMQQQSPYMQQQSQFNPYVGMFGGGFNPMMQQMPQMQQPRMSFQQEQQQLLANQAYGRPTMGVSRPPQQQFNPYAQMSRPTMFGTTMQNPIMQAPWFQQAQRQPLMQGQYGYGNSSN